MAGLSGNRAISLLERLHHQSQTYHQGYAKLDRLLHWANDSTGGAQGTHSPLAKRAAALATAIAFASDIAFAITIFFDNESAITSAFASAFASGSTRTRNRNSDGISVSDSAIAHAIAIAGASAIAIATAFTSVSISFRVKVSSFDIVIASTIASTIASVSNLEHIFGSPKFSDLPDQLKRRSEQIPNEKDASEAWQAWADEIEMLWLDALGLKRGDLAFDLEETEALSDCLQATVLLIRCKEAAVRIPKREWAELEARLLTV